MSSTEAEFVGVNMVARELTWVQQLLHNLFECHVTPMIYTDNQAAQEWVTSESIKYKVAKHIDIRYKHVRHLYKEKLMNIGWKSTDLMLADVLTKNLTKVKFVNFRDQLLDNGVNGVSAIITGTGGTGTKFTGTVSAVTNVTDTVSAVQELVVH